MSLKIDARICKISRYFLTNLQKNIITVDLVFSNIGYSILTDKAYMAAGP